MNSDVLTNFLRKPLLWALAAGLMLGTGFIINTFSTPEAMILGSSSGAKKFPIWCAYLTSYGISMTTFDGAQGMISSSFLLGIVCVVVGLLLIGLITKQARNAVYAMGPLIAYALATTSCFTMMLRRAAFPVNAWSAMFGFIICVVILAFVAQRILSVQRFIRGIDSTSVWEDFDFKSMWLWLKQRFRSKSDGSKSSQDKSSDNQRSPTTESASPVAVENGNGGGQIQVVANGGLEVSPAEKTTGKARHCCKCGRKKFFTDRGSGMRCCKHCDIPVDNLRCGEPCGNCPAVNVDHPLAKHCPACGKDREAQKMIADMGAV